MRWNDSASALRPPDNVSASAFLRGSIGSLPVTIRFVPLCAGCITAHSLLGDGRMLDTVNERVAEASHEVGLRDCQPRP